MALNITLSPTQAAILVPLLQKIGSVGGNNQEISTPRSGHGSDSMAGRGSPPATSTLISPSTSGS